jgi:arsenite-transporting ATPase
MVLDKLNRNRKGQTRFLFFSGKGGVGKTSVAAATALWLSRKKKVLIISTDPAHSLSDSFDRKIGGEVRKLEKNLYAVEIDPELSMKEYKEMLSPQLEKVSALKGLGLEDSLDVAGMTPGIDEIASFDRFLVYMNSDEYEVVVFDTAPTGHTLRLLSLPDVLDSWIGKIIKIRMRFSGIAGAVKRLIGGGDEDEKDTTLERLEDMKQRIKRAKEILTDPERTSYNIVMIPEAMSIYESERSVCFLKDVCIPVDRIIVNQIIPENSHCRFCSGKRKLQLERLSEIRKGFSSNMILEVPMFREEVRGKPMLEKVARELYSREK